MSSVRIKNKQKIYEFSKKLKSTNPDNIDSLLKEYYDENVVLYGPEPINTLKGIESVSEKFYKPFLTSFPDLQKDNYILFSGEFMDGDWVCATGNYVGTFQNDWLDIPATKGSVWIRYGEFHKFKDGKIVETRTIIEILDLMRQAGFRFVPSLAPEIIIPGPSTKDGILLGECDATQTAKSLKLVEDMLFVGLREDFHDKGVEGLGMERYWSKDMMWYGPCGIGSTRGVDGFMKYHEEPFCVAFPDHMGSNHYARFAEGKYVASSGWPSITGTHAGDNFLGLPATNKTITMRIMDFWRREEDELIENWVFIDMIDVLKQMGVDVFDRMKNNKYIIK